LRKETVMQRIVASLFFAGSVLGLAASAAAQASDLPIEQIAPRDSEAVSQISDGSTEILRPPAPEPRTSLSPTQLAREKESGPAAEQLTPERRSLPRPAQLAPGSRSAQPPQSISKPEDGRRAAVERVEGEDRCDPAKHPSGKTLRANCSRVIENRAAEFKGGQVTPPLSPEQRLLIDQQLRDRASDPRSAARRLATTGEDHDSIEAQGVASVVLGRSLDQSGKENKTHENGPESAAEAAAILNAIVNQPTSGSPR
jgi:hypothetical protein